MRPVISHKLGSVSAKIGYALRCAQQSRRLGCSCHATSIAGQAILLVDTGTGTRGIRHGTGPHLRSYWGCAMWELICDHKYNWGLIAADRSPWRSDGILSGVSALPGRAGLHFSSAQSQIAVPRRASDPWGRLGALAVEVVARVEQPGGTLVHGDQSFRIWSSSQNAIFAETPSGVIGGGSGIPLGEWARIRFTHNGFNQYGLSYEYQMASGGGGSGGGAAPTTTAVPGVGPSGVLIGNRIASSGEHLTGDIAAVRIWRIDATAADDQFASRPFDPDTRACWGTFMNALQEVLKANPNCAEFLTSVIKGIVHEFAEALANLDPSDFAEFRAMCAEYRDLWAAGRVDSVEMLTLVKRLRDWLKDKGLLDMDDPALHARLDSPCLDMLRDSLPPLDCDPAAKALLAAIMTRD